MDKDRYLESDEMVRKGYALSVYAQGRNSNEVTIGNNVFTYCNRRTPGDG